MNLLRISRSASSPWGSRRPSSASSCHRSGRHSGSLRASVSSAAGSGDLSVSIHLVGCYARGER
eukprot:4400926-Heterocapsa_arctica.AAC.1